MDMIRVESEPSPSSLGLLVTQILVVTTAIILENKLVSLYQTLWMSINHELKSNPKTVDRTP